MISIIITAYKEEKTIAKAIQSFLDNNVKDKYEILVLAPDKPTLEIVKQFSKENKNIIPIVDPGKGKPTALNLAFQKAKGEILILTDGDVRMDKNAIKPLLRRFQNPDIGAVSGHPISLNPKNNLLGFWSHLLTNIADLRRKKAIKLKKRFFCSGYLFAMRAGIIKQIPSETLSDDGYMSYLIHQAGYQITYSSESRVYVKYPTTLKDWLNQKRRSAGGYNQIKAWTKTEMRSFSKESRGALDCFKFVSNPQELIWLFSLFLTRLYLWLLIFRDINLKKKQFKDIWIRIESTK